MGATFDIKIKKATLWDKMTPEDEKQDVQKNLAAINEAVLNEETYVVDYELDLEKAVAYKKGGAPINAYWFPVLTGFVDKEGKGILDKVLDDGEPADANHSSDWGGTEENQWKLTWYGLAPGIVAGRTYTGRETYTYGNETIHVAVRFTTKDPNAYDPTTDGEAVSGGPEGATQKELDAGDFSATNYPTVVGKLYSGWFSDAECTTPAPEATGTLHARFIPEKVLTLKSQVSDNATMQAPYINLRLVTSLPDKNVKSAGFKILLGDNGLGTPNVVEVGEISETLKAQGEDADLSSNFDPASGLFAALTIAHVPNCFFEDGHLRVTPYWVTLDGAHVDGAVSTISIKELIEAQAAVGPIEKDD